MLERDREIIKIEMVWIYRVININEDTILILKFRTFIYKFLHFFKIKLPFITTFHFSIFQYPGEERR